MDRKDLSIELAVLVAVCLFGFIGLCARVLHDHGLTSMEIVQLRMIFATGVLALAICVSGVGGFRIKIKDLWIFVLFGLFKNLSDLTFFQSQITLTLSLSTLLQMTAPYYVLILSLVLFRERITLRKIGAMMLTFVGLILVIGVPQDSSMESIGVVLALVSGLFYSTFCIGSKVIDNRGYKPITGVFYMFLFSLVFSLPFSEPSAVVRALSDTDVLPYCAVLGVFLTALPFFVMTWGTTRLGACKVSTISVMEAVSSTLVGFVFFGESLSPINIVGMSVVVASIALMDIHIRGRIRKRIHLPEHLHHRVR